MEIGDTPGGPTGGAGAGAGAGAPGPTRAAAADVSTGESGRGRSRAAGAGSIVLAKANDELLADQDMDMRPLRLCEMGLDFGAACGGESTHAKYIE